MKKYVLAISLMVVPLAGVFAAPLSAREWPEVTLRGYGELSAQSMTGAGFSRLRIRCESVEKAEILHAKFISDCRALGGVEDTSLPAGGIAVPVLVVPEQGLVSAFITAERDGYFQRPK